MLYTIENFPVSQSISGQLCMYMFAFEMELSLSLCYLISAVLVGLVCVDSGYEATVF